MLCWVVRSLLLSLGWTAVPGQSFQNVTILLIEFLEEEAKQSTLIITFPVVCKSIKNRTTALI